MSDIIQLKRKIIFFLLFLSFLSNACEDIKIQECDNEAMTYPNKWIRCDECVCKEFSKYHQQAIDDDGFYCNIQDTYLYNCLVMYEVDNLGIEWECQTRMKISWIIGFVFISIFGCLLIIFFFYLLITFVDKVKENEIALIDVPT